MIIKRMLNLMSGKIRRWVRTREARDPEAVYEAAINTRLQRYQQLKSAAAAVIYMRNKLTSELSSKRAMIDELTEQTAQAADLNEDQCAIIMIRRRHELEADCKRLEQELAEVSREADEAKGGLISSRDEIEKLKVEKIKMLARLKNAQARIRIQSTLSSTPSYEDDLRALEEMRDTIGQTLARAGVNHELGNSELDAKLADIGRRNIEANAAAELEELKRRRRPPLMPMTLFAPIGAAARAESNSGSAQ
ncbi:MAG TPA: PspA/IM30 family protein [Candidatus Binataceae bacterium]|nr:PspA/IM30 family protein [Candidatus Binataceae bacterium]